MAETYPDEVTTFKVVGRLGRGVADSADVGQAPDLVPIVGAKIIFTPTLETPVFTVPGAEEPITVFQESVEATTDAQGRIKVPDAEELGVILAYGHAEGINPRGWNWQVSIDVGGTFEPRIFSITGVPGEDVDLARAVHVPSDPGEDVSEWLQAVQVTEANRNSTSADAARAEDAAGRAEAVDLSADTYWVAKIQEGPVRNELLSTLADHAVTSVSPLARWFAALNGSPSTAKIAVVGDSTRDSAAAGVNYHNAIKRYIVAGGPLEGMTDANVLNHGRNGATVQVITNTVNMALLTEAAPDLVEFSMGINNIRATALTVDQMEAILVAGVDAIRAAVPGVPLVGTVPNSFLTTADAGNYVTPNSEAQAKSLILRMAYLRLIDRWPDVIIRDTVDVFGATSQASSPYLSDQIHPNGAGCDASVLGLIALIGRTLAPVRALQVAARTVAPYEPWSIYGREVEDRDRYVLVAEGNYAASAAGSYVDFDFSFAASGNILQRDLVEMPDGQVFVKGASAQSTPGLDRTRILDAGVPAYSQPALSGNRYGKVRVWRRSVPVSAATRGVLLDGSWRYKRVGLVAAASTTSVTASQRVIDIRATSLTPFAPSEAAAIWNAQPGDRLYIDGMGESRTVSATTVSGSATITATLAASDVGRSITGAGIPAGSTIVSVDTGAGTAVISNNATASATITATVTLPEYFTLGTGNVIGVNATDLRLSAVSQLDRNALRYRLAVLVGAHA